MTSIWFAPFRRFPPGFTVHKRDTTQVAIRIALGLMEARAIGFQPGSGRSVWTGEDVGQFAYWVAAPARGQGYATRAAILLARGLFERGAARVFSTIVAENHGSAAVARRAGFEHEGTMRDYGIWQGQR